MVKPASQQGWGRAEGKQLMFFSTSSGGQKPHSLGATLKTHPSAPFPVYPGLLAMEPYFPKVLWKCVKNLQLPVAAGYYLTFHLREGQSYLSIQLSGQENINGARRLSISESGDPLPVTLEYLYSEYHPEISLIKGCHRQIHVYY